MIVSWSVAAAEPVVAVQPAAVAAAASLEVAASLDVAVPLETGRSPAAWAFPPGPSAGVGCDVPRWTATPSMTGSIPSGCRRSLTPGRRPFRDPAWPRVPGAYPDVGSWA
ncbi:hypothetical protein, partial [Frankia sp. Cr2]|uniref:hypothetical protein n=1 Tax=Frankia sp. Cr2 TaxID=3073932 RepID=UPI002AD54286